MEKALAQQKVISPEDHAKVKNLANIVRPLRSVLFKTPDNYGLTGWRNVYFPSDDGTPVVSMAAISGVKMPVLMIRARGDSWTRNPEDAQETFDLLGSEDKE